MASLTGSIAVRKTSDETVNNSNTLQDDDDLVIAVGANEVWYFEALLLCSSNTTADYKFNVTVPSGATLTWVLLGPLNTDDTPSVSAGAGIAGNQDIGGAAVRIMIRGMLRVSSTAGNLQLQWAQNTANASDTKVLTDSWLMGARES